MSPGVLVIVGLGALIAFVNGANDVGKGVSTLVGGGVTSYRRAILWGTFWTGAGALSASAVASKLMTTFGTGLLAPGVSPSFAAALATIIGAAAWVLLATRTGLPVSTTHAIVGSLCGVAILAYGPHGVRWATLTGKVALPLAASPLVAFALAAVFSRAARALASRRAHRADCACIDLSPRPAAIAIGPGGEAALGSPALHLQLVTGTASECAVERPHALRLSFDGLHWLTSGATSFARGLNDAPKMVAIVIAASALGAWSTATLPAGFLAVTIGMAAGSAVAGERVARVLAEKVTRLDHREGFRANLVTSILVMGGTFLGLPMSTTHVSTGAIVGAGAAGAVNRGTVRNLAAAWLVTLPAAGVLGAVAFVTLGGLR